MAPRPVVLRFIGDTSSLTRSFTVAQGQAAAFGSTVAGLNSGLYNTSQVMISAGATLSRRLTLPIAVASGAAAKLAVDFETSMVKIETLAGESRSQVAAWSDDVLNLSKAFGKSPKELADALYFIASSGIDASHAMDVLTASAKASVIGLGETKTVADAITSAINAYGFENLSAARATDILLAAVREGKGEAEDFAGSIGRVIAPAQLLGVSFDQVAAAMSSMTLVGLSADESATALRQVLFTLAKPSAQTKKALEEVGLSADEVRKSIRERGLLGALIDLRDKVGDNDELLTQLFPNIRAFNGLTIMTGENLGNTARIFDTLNGATGDVDRAFARTSETSAFKLNKSLADIQVVGTELGAIVIPHIVESASRLASIITTAWGKLNPETQKLAVNIALLVAALGPMLRILGNVGSLLAFFLSPVGAVILAIVAVGVAFYLAYTRIEGFRNAVDAVGSFIVRVVDFIRDLNLSWQEMAAILAIVVGSGLTALAAGLYLAYSRIEPFRNAVDAVGRVIRDVAVKSFNWLKTNVPPIMETVSTATTRALGGVNSAFDATSAKVTSFANWLNEYVMPVVTEVFGLIADIVSIFVMPVLVAAFDNIMWAGSFAFGILSAAVDIFIDVVRDSAPFVQATFEFIIAVITNFWNVLKPVIDVIATALVIGFQYAFGTIKAIVEGFLMVVRGIIEVIRGIITGDWSKVWQGIQDIFGGIWHGMEGVVKTSIDTIVRFVTELPGKLLNVLAALGDAGKQLGEKFVNMLVEGIKGIANSAIDIARGLGEAVYDALKSAWNKLIDVMNGTTNKVEIDLPWPLGTVGLPDNMWNFLKLANGGIINGPTRALIGEAGAEAVVPLTKPRRAARIMEEAGLIPAGSAATGQSVTVNQYITAMDPREAARQSTDEWYWAMKTSGL
jgi:TP901 family phage tail tape measure protein